MQGDIFYQGLELMLYGMGTVVVFLTLLIATVCVMSWFLNRFLPDDEVPVAVAETARMAPALASEVPLAVIIAAAVHHHRSATK